MSEEKDFVDHNGVNWSDFKAEKQTDPSSLGMNQIVSMGRGFGKSVSGYRFMEQLKWIMEQLLTGSDKRVGIYCRPSHFAVISDYLRKGTDWLNFETEDEIINNENGNRLVRMDKAIQIDPDEVDILKEYDRTRWYDEPVSTEMTPAAYAYLLDRRVKDLCKYPRPKDARDMFLGKWDITETPDKDESNE